MSALRFRRIALIVAPLLAAVLIVAGIFLDPDIDESGRDLAQEYAENPGVTQLSAVSFHFAFVVWAPLVFALVGLVRGRGALARERRRATRRARRYDAPGLPDRRLL